VTIRELVVRPVRAAVEPSQFLADRSLGRALESRIDGQINPQARFLSWKLMMRIYERRVGKNLNVRRNQAWRYLFAYSPFFTLGWFAAICFIILSD
jgi:hypothetical protein